jgi:hypothetical protein
MSGFKFDDALYPLSNGRGLGRGFILSLFSKELDRPALA